MHRATLAGLTAAPKKCAPALITSCHVPVCAHPCAKRSHAPQEASRVEDSVSAEPSASRRTPPRQERRLEGLFTTARHQVNANIDPPSHSAYSRLKSTFPCEFDDGITYSVLLATRLTTPDPKTPTSKSRPDNALPAL